MNKKIFFGILVLAAGVLVGLYVFRGNPPSPESLFNQKETEQTASPTTKAGGTPGDIETIPTGEESEKGGVASRSVVTYTDSGFGPSIITVKVGTTVTFVNESGRGMWVASAVHPTHQLLPGFDQLAIAPKGGIYEYTFTKVGTWKYHNHVNPADTASVVVNE